MVRTDLTTDVIGDLTGNLTGTPIRWQSEAL